jgi:hypothetical protein
VTSDELDRHIAYNERRYGKSDVQDYKDLATALRRERKEEHNRELRKEWSRYRDSDCY